jgi:hypothetical protein
MSNENRFFPAIGTLRRYAAEAGGGVTPGWDKAWARVMEAVKRWSEVQHDREKAIAVRESVADLMPCIRALGGFYDLSMADNKQLSVLQSNFRDAWNRQANVATENSKLPERLIPRERAAIPLGNTGNPQEFLTDDRNKHGLNKRGNHERAGTKDRSGEGDARQATSEVRPRD